MEDNFSKVKDYLLELGHTITFEDMEDGVIVVENEESGIKNLVLGIADPILIVEQYIFEIKNGAADTYLKLLQMNRDFIHGAFAVDESGRKVLFRNTHELENLDLNELEATINSLALLLSEHSRQIISLSAV
ncbi:MAG: YbjN domain-containing protein [Cyclobacteriaceae bacterium]|nr:YbjN domain-containing protein [Cyclobacteriaceae bacterium]